MLAKGILLAAIAAQEDLAKKRLGGARLGPETTFFR
jgi:hypothetical protein